VISLRIKKSARLDDKHKEEFFPGHYKGILSAAPISQ
jgi:hypothetical protein